MEGSFYSDGMNPEFKHNWPVIVPAGGHAYTYNDVCDMGCRRMKHYDLYGKQFEFFCPIWLEHLADYLVFNFSVYDGTGEHLVARRTLTIERGDVTNKFNRYFNSYITNCGIDVGTDDVMRINIGENTAYVTGLNVKTGLHTVRDISNVVNIITSRERPLMEFDNILISNLSNNNIVVNQLFNFNFCFNLNDIVSSAIADLMIGKQLTISVDVSVGDELLDKVDFNTEYDYIQKQLIHSDDSIKEDINVLNYLIDYKCIDLIDKNKYNQQVCHWSLCDCNDYIFNLYNGFSGYSISKGKVIQANHQYGKTPSLDTSKHSDFTNNIGWLNIFNFTEWSEFYLFTMDIDTYKDKMSVFGGKTFVNDIKYSKIPQTPIYFCGLNVNSELFTKILNNNPQHIPIHGNLSAIIYDDVVIFVTDNLDELTHNAILKSFKKITTNDPILSKFVDIFNSFVSPSVITISSSLSAERSDGPSYDTDEMIYFKDNNHSEYVIRYDGKIKPTFTKSRTLYYKDYVSDDRSNGLSTLQRSIYGMYIATGYEPLYKSIGYYSILSTEMDYKNVPSVQYSETKNHTDTHVPLIQIPEYKWFNDGMSMSVKDNHRFTIVKTMTDDLEKMVCDCLGDIYGSDNISYVRSLYNIEYDWDYLSPTEINEYKYNIILRLK
jgi:hypothetical protein